MKCKTNILGRIFIKILGFFLTGVLVSMALLADVDTLAWFSSRVVGNLEVQAASAEDIIQEFFTESDGEKSSLNPDTIVIKRAPGMKGKMTVYFSLENTDPDEDSAHGLRAYVLHINPAEIEENGENEVRVPLELKFNWRDLLYLLNDINGKTEGTLTLRYFNGFIIEQREISFDNWYLFCMGFDSLALAKSGKTMDMKKIKTSNREQLEAFMVDIMADIAGNIKWKEVGARIETLSNPFARIELTKEQQSIIDIVAPGLRQYVDELYSFVEDLIARLNEKIAKIEELNLQIKDMNTRIQSLNTTIDELTQKYTALEQEKVSLAEEKLKLEEENQRLKDKIDDLKDEIDSLESKNSSLNDEIENLKSSNNFLEEQIKKLEEENENLKKQLEDLKNSAPSGGGSGDTASEGSINNGNGGAPSDGQQPPIGDPQTGTQPPAQGEPPAPGTPDNGEPPAGQQPPAAETPVVEPPPVEEPGLPPSRDINDDIETPPAETQPPAIQEPPAASQPPIDNPAEGQPPDGDNPPEVETPENRPEQTQQPATPDNATGQTPDSAEDVLIAP